MLYCLYKMFYSDKLSGDHCFIGKYTKEKKL